ncbi:unnamed protein product, partial [Vitis vinifera]|uniref:RING-type domain-containing protein n=1 Tax=Vitis vinifera TaxID=29760 RepID=D7UBQ8_VITVI
MSRTGGTLVLKGFWRGTAARNPIVEDLQSIFVCGHVFHELCLQQWFEYCASKKKNNCPVCKQICSVNGVNQLYFQSIGDASDPIVSQKSLNLEEDPRALRREVKRLEVKVAGLTSVLERNQKDLKELNEELCLCKEQKQNRMDMVYTDGFVTPVATLNLAIVWFHFHEYGKALSILESLYQNIEPIDETTALHICLLLLDVALASHNASRCASR